MFQMLPIKSPNLIESFTNVLIHLPVKYIAATTSTKTTKHIITNKKCMNQEYNLFISRFFWDLSHRPCPSSSSAESLSTSRTPLVTEALGVSLRACKSSSSELFSLLGLFKIQILTDTVLKVISNHIVGYYSFSFCFIVDLLPWATSRMSLIAKRPS